MMQSMFESLEARALMSAAMPAGHTLLEPHKSGDGGNTTVVIPAKPSGLAAAASGKCVTLTWADNSDNETGFVIQRVTPGSGVVDVGTVAANIKTFTDKSAPVGMDYYLVRSFNTAGRSEGSNPVSVKISEVVTLIAPKLLSTAAVSTTQIKVSWSGDAGVTGGYVLERSNDGSTGWTAVGTAAPGVRSITDQNLNKGTKYFYRIRCLGDGGATATSSVIIGMTKKTDTGK